MKCFDILVEKSKNRECFKEIVHGAGNFLHLAIMCGRTEMLEHLLTQYSEDVKFLIDDGKNHHGCTPFIMAADQGDVEALMLLHSHGANIEGKDSEGRTALHHAVIKNQVQTLELLIFLKADVNAIDHHGKRPEYYTKNNLFLEKIMNNALLNQNLMENRRPNFVEYYPENLIFQGGGPAGICHLGALKELEKKQILSKAIRMAGTSAGSIIAAFLSIGYTVDEAKKILMATKLIDLMDYSHLSRPLPEFITHGKKVIEGISEQKGFFKKFIKFITSVKIKDISDARIIFKDLKKTTGLSKGEVLRTWIGAVIKGKTGDENLTFGELRNKIKQGSPYKHLHVFVTDIGTGPNILSFNSEDEKYDSIIIADAVRASAAIPGVFEPHIIHHKVEGRRQPFNDRLLVDGGMLYNLPVEAFDKKKMDHKNRFAEGGRGVSDV